MDINALISAVASLLSRFACKRLAVDGADEKTGVWVQRNDSGKFLFVFTTDDHITVKVLFDAKNMTKHYIANMVKGVITELESKRKERQKNNVIEIATLAEVAHISGGRK